MVLLHSANTAIQGPRLLNAGLRLYNLADHWFERIGLGRWFGVFVVTAGRKPERDA